MNDYQAIRHPILSDSGLNLQAVFNLTDIPSEVFECHDASFSQLILFAHGGRQMWTALQSTHPVSADPVDDFSRHVVAQYFQHALPQHRFRIIYPGTQTIGLQRLGVLAGWHHDSPFRIGVNNDWGSWFAYRVAVLADTQLTPSKRIESESPCIPCGEKYCIDACPARAMDNGAFSLDACVSYRLEADSRCKKNCLARVACPVAQQHRYSDEQIAYHYGVSMKTIERYYRSATT